MLTPDALYSVALKAEGKELLRMCATDKETRRICMSDKFIPIWREKLRKEYNMDLPFTIKNPYQIYMQTVHIYNQNYWVAIMTEDIGEIIYSGIFTTKEIAADALAYQAEGNYAEVLNKLMKQGYYFDDTSNTTYHISQKQIDNSFSNKYTEYSENLGKLWEISRQLKKNNFTESFEKFKGVFDNFMTENDDLSRNLAFDYFVEEIELDDLSEEELQHLKDVFMKIVEI